MRFASVMSAGASSAAVLDGDDWRALPASDVSDLLRSTSLDVVETDIAGIGTCALPCTSSLDMPRGGAADGTRSHEVRP